MTEQRKCGWRVEGLEGRGAFSEVYRVRRERDGLLLACKVTGERAQWERESALFRAISQYHHALFPRWYESWEERGRYCLLLEYVAGQSLKELLARRGRLSQRQTVEIGRALAEGMAFLAEKAGILYRDLNPDNVRICQDGRVKLIDFGCVCPLERQGRADRSGFGRAGTPGYAAPEQLNEAGRVGTYSDVYALGRLLHGLVTGDDPCLPPRRKPPIRAYDRRLSRRLERLLEECVRADGRERPPEMRRVLRRLCVLQEERGPGAAWGELREALRRGKEPDYRFEKHLFRGKGEALSWKAVASDGKL